MPANRLGLRYSSSLARGLSILESFAPNRQLLGISELAEHLHMTNTTVHRYVRTLERLGYLAQDPGTRRYRLAPGVVDLGLATVNSMSVRDLANPVLRQLSNDSQQTTNLTILDDLEIIYIDRVVWPMSLNLALHVGSRLPAYYTSMGKVLLANLPEDDLKSRVSRIRFVRGGENIPSNRGALMKELRRVRVQGYAVNNNGLGHGLRSIAAPVRAGSGAVVAAINLAVPASSVSAKELADQYAPMVIAAGMEISRQMGYIADERVWNGRHRVNGRAPRSR